MKEKNERRKYKRIKISKVGADYRLVDFNFWAESRSRGSNALKDISLGGISFSTNDAMPQDSLVSLNLKLGDVVKVGDVYGRVVRMREIKNNEYEIGINFSWWDKEEDRKNLAMMLEDRPLPFKAG
ncbi:MAG: PilZ domain-containing protein [Candidatus Omnitrophica bacterium]|nr:PilZ domain-containing protein [Candidatus Omnitrophota bacterium]